jgi:nucleotide-binding universal stress UspA family protein
MKLPRILVPVDFSPCSVAAVSAAATLARRSGAAVSITHVVPPRDTGYVSIEPMYLPPRIAETLYQEHLRNAERELSELADRARALAPTATVQTEIVSGEPMAEILRISAESADLIVMGSHGHTGAVRFLLGSVAEKVSRRATCPVLVVPDQPDGQVDEDALPRFEHILAAVDYGPATDGVVRLAADLAAPVGTVHLVHVWSPPMFPSLTATGASTEITSSLDEQRLHEVRRLEGFAAELQLGDSLHVKPFVGSGHVIDELLERADEVSADVIVMGSHSRDSIVERVLGTVADRVLRHARRPVLLVPTPL